MFEYATKVCKIQFVVASRPCAVLDMRPSTTNNSTSNQDPKFTALTSPTLVLGPSWIPNEHQKIANKPRRSSQDSKQAQTLGEPPMGLLHPPYYAKVIMPKYSANNDLNEGALVIHEYACNLRSTS